MMALGLPPLRLNLHYRLGDYLVSPTKKTPFGQLSCYWGNLHTRQDVTTHCERLRRLHLPGVSNLIHPMTIKRPGYKILLLYGTRAKLLAFC
ncbi:unnamed protein product [Protopolystoma xenopodis]|uniref:Uncharacterized protein n=1 Tax=Protopolystoma xenopodis TaxID=117903 RepID=A0A3S5FGX9_9PLAT|nr:unnamed protein product [Protopolystoma xenopodis]